MKMKHLINWSIASRRPRVAVAALVAALAALVTAAPSFAAFSHDEVKSTFSIGADCSRVTDIAVDETGGYVYASCLEGESGRTIRRFDLNGNPADFPVVSPYTKNNALVGDPVSVQKKFHGPGPRIAVDNSASGNKGKLFITSTPHVVVFNSDGSFSSPLLQPVESTVDNVISGVDIGPNGFIYVTSRSPGDRISKYDPAFNEVKRLYGSVGENDDTTNFGNPNDVQVDSTEAAWMKHGEFADGYGGSLSKFEADQFTDALSITSFQAGGLGAKASEIEPYVAQGSPFSANPLIAGVLFFGELGLYDVDLTDNDLYVARKNRVEIYTSGNANESAHQAARPFGLGGTLNNAYAIAVTKNHDVFVSKGSNQIVKFGPGAIVPDIGTAKPTIDDIGHTEVTVRGTVDPAGGAAVTACEVEYSLDPSFGPGTPTAPCQPDPAAALPGSSFAVPTNVSAELSGLTTGSNYHFRIRAANPQGDNLGMTRTATPAYVLKVQTLAVEDVDLGGAELRGSFDADGMPTTYHFEYGTTDAYGFSTPEESGGSASGVAEFGKTLTGLPKGRTFHYRIVAENAGGTTAGPDMTFRTASPPDVTGVQAADTAETSATIEGRVNPVGFETKYRFEYGTTTSYGEVVPAEMTGVGSGTEAVGVSHELTGLRSGVTYHFRLVAENKWGISRSPDTTFDYFPPSCPNQLVRQQTIGSYLPDCRAYELVSPGAAGAVTFYPGNVAARKNQPNPFSVFPHEFVQYIVNRGFASSPSRFAYYGGVGVVTGTDAANSAIDMYMATRTPTGWETTVPGLDTSETGGLEAGGRRECSETLDLCIDHQEAREYGYERENAPYLFTADGRRIRQLPTNVGLIPGGNRFWGEQRMSGDFTHFVFSSTGSPVSGAPGVRFAPGAVASGAGTAYDNDLNAQTVTIVSRLPSGGIIPTEGEPQKGVGLPGLSSDGSHILMETPTGGPLRRLFMRVDQAVTYDVSRGAGVETIGMTRDGGKVLFATDVPLADGDTDSGADIYMWEEAGDSLTRLSQGNGAGDADGCAPVWGGSGCGAEPLDPERAHPDKNTANSVPTAQDDLLAENAGDVYFYSPEILDPDNPGIPNERNLYVYRDGAVQLVAILDPGTEINRMQISPDGTHAAMLTESRLTSYDNRGFRQMYTYNADTGEIRCASCHPSGAPPTADVVASQGGRFMSDDGRAFFTTSNSLVPRDQNGKINDVYEYVDGRPQLITSGLGSRDFTGGGKTLTLLFDPEYTGLEAVSHDGTDVYFSTFESLVASDKNGQFVKFYNARTGGGFIQDPILAPCVAADECHGMDSSPPPAPRVATDVPLGSGGNASEPAQAEKPKKKKKKKKRGKGKGKKAKGKKSARQGRRSHG